MYFVGDSYCRFLVLTNLVQGIFFYPRQDFILYCPLEAHSGRMLVPHVTFGRCELSAICRDLYVIPSGGFCFAAKLLEGVDYFPPDGFALLHPLEGVFRWSFLLEGFGSALTQTFWNAPGIITFYHLQDYTLVSSGGSTSHANTSGEGKQGFDSALRHLVRYQVTRTGGIYIYIYID